MNATEAKEIYKSTRRSAEDLASQAVGLLCVQGLVEAENGGLGALRVAIGNIKHALMQIVRG